MSRCMQIHLLFLWMFHYPLYPHLYPDPYSSLPLHFLMAQSVGKIELRRAVESLLPQCATSRHSWLLYNWHHTKPAQPFPHTHSNQQNAQRYGACSSAQPGRFL